ncbi:MAG: alkaline phosphatase [Bacteroidales bacterium]|nr:alkaline phosphatase [Bacteroidales bacterium]
MKTNKILLLLAFISIINLGWAQKQGYLKGDYKKEDAGNIYTAQFQHKVDQIKAIADANAEIHNVILMIGDGMGVSQVFAAMSANNDELYIQYAKHIGFQKTKCTDKFTTDSAASGTALATGSKTTYRTIGLDENGKEVKSILEIASENGKATALVACAKITHATPAAFIAHVPIRSQYEDIATFFISDELDVFIGGGLDDFNKREDAKSLIPQLEEKGFQVVTTPESLNEIKSGKIAGLLATGHIDRYPTRGEFLVESTKKALEILSQDKEGFFMMVEGSQIDWACHDNDVGYVIREMLDFDRTVGEVLKFAEKDGHTLVIITGDHETGGMSVQNVDLEKGEVEARFTTGGHSSVMLPVFAYGPGADLFLGIYENTAIFDKMMTAFGFEK